MISDEQIAEIERGCFDATPYAVEKLITRLREAEKDAARYRWLRDDATNLDGWSPAVAVTDGSYVSYCLDGRDLDEAIDTAMQGDK